MLANLAMKDYAGFILLICILISQDLQADPGNLPIEKGYRFLQFFYHTGTNFGPTSYLDEKYTWGSKAYEIRYGFQSNGKELWQQYHHLPQYGIGFHYADLIADKADTAVGNPFSIFMFFSKPFARLGKFTFSTDLSLGLSYTSKYYDPKINPYNDVIGSPINLYFDLNANLRYPLNRKVNLSFGTGITHYSNGAMAKPQKGMNTIRLNAGMSYNIINPGFRTKERQREDYTQMQTGGIPKDNLYITTTEAVQLMASVGVVEEQRVGELQGHHFVTSSITVDYAFPLTPINNITLGLDALFDGSIMMTIEGIPPDEVSFMQKTYLGSHIGYQILIHRFTLLVNLGTYFRQSTFDSGFWFIRAGGRIRISDQLHSHICIKTKDGFNSDWIEWGMAYYINIRASNATPD